MTKINSEQLDEFKKIYKQKFNIDLSDQKALEYALSLVNLMRVLISNKTLWN